MRDIAPEIPRNLGCAALDGRAGARGEPVIAGAVCVHVEGEVAARDPADLQSSQVGTRMLVLALRGHPCMVVSDNGTEFTSNAILKRLEERRLERRATAAGKPIQTGFVESFNGRLRDECLNEHLFAKLRHAVVHLARPDGATINAPDPGVARRLHPSPPTHRPRTAHPVGISPEVSRRPTPGTERTKERSLSGDQVKRVESTGCGAGSEVFGIQETGANT
ncbi:transposase [Mesobaculum littorinae]|uniref:Transposase n=1 Tax=Mesobaculum littorinae TaxID=2486419 RepID=A0A438ADM7_9RHOB|nr:transposase [Mesobaculum littorinae]